MSRCAFSWMNAIALRNVRGCAADISAKSRISPWVYPRIEIPNRPAADHRPDTICI
jgi:hypothetical protein